MASSAVWAPTPPPRSDGLVRSDAAASLAAVCEATSTEHSDVFHAVARLCPQWQAVSTPPSPMASSATICPRPSLAATSTEATSTVLDPLSRQSTVGLADPTKLAHERVMGSSPVRQTVVIAHGFESCDDQGYSPGKLLTVLNASA